MSEVQKVYQAALSLRRRIIAYRRQMKEIGEYLQGKPDGWRRFQSEFNQEINSIFREIMVFEKQNLIFNKEDRVYKLKQLFIKRFRSDFVCGECIRRSLEKPLGYAGDFKIIDDIYINMPATAGIDRLFDNYAQMSSVAIAIRNRKEDFKQMILEFVLKSRGMIRIMDLASGPGRIVREVLDAVNIKQQEITFHCYDQDAQAINYATNILKDHLSKVKFIKENAIRIALKTDINGYISQRYNLIYSTGLFDYLDSRIAIRLIANLKKLLMPGGLLIIANMTEKYQNPSVYFLEWVGDWNLIYRTESEFKKLFVEAGFREKDLDVKAEQQGIIQYIIASV